MSYSKYYKGYLPYVLFDGLHSYKDLGILLKEVEIGVPQRKVTKIQSPIMNGDLDITDALTDEPVYSNRNINLVFDVLDDYKSVYSDVVNALNGNKMFVYVSTMDRAYVGRVSINIFRTSYRYATITISVDASPDSYLTVRNYTFKGTISTAGNSTRFDVGVSYLNKGYTIFAKSNVDGLSVDATCTNSGWVSMVKGKYVEIGDVSKFTSSNTAVYVKSDIADNTFELELQIRKKEIG